MLRRLDLYIFREILTPFGLTLGTLMLVLLTDQLIRLVELIVSKGVGFFDVARIFLWILPPFLVISLPAGVLIGVIIAFNRLSSDNEIIAMQANGLGLVRLVVPAAAFSALAFAVTFSLSVWGHPWSGQSIKELALSILKNQMTLVVTPGSFNEPFDDMVFFVDRMPSPDRLKGILIHDLRNPETPVLTLAQSGTVAGSESGNVVGFSLLEGNQYRFDTRVPERQQHLKFSRYEFRMDLTADLGGSTQDQDRLTPKELKKAMEDDPAKAPRYRRLLAEHYKNYAYPFSCLIFGLLGVPTGVTFRKTGRLGGFALGLLLGTTYYFLLFVGDFLATSGSVSPALAAWLPNMLMLALAVTALAVTVRPLNVLRSWIDRI